MKKKWFKLIVLCGLLTLLLAVVPVSLAQDTHGADFSGELTVAVWGQIDLVTDRPDAYVMHEIFQEWAAMYPNVTLKYEYIGGTGVAERFAWINTNLLAGTLPDIVLMYFPGPDITNAVDLVYNFNEDLAQPNPYSTNPTWFDDFPLDGLVLNNSVASDGGHRVVGPTLSGDTGVTTYAYNKTVFDELGIDVPQTWGEFMSIQQTLQDAGYTPFMMPMAGPDAFLWNWAEWTIREQLMADVIQECDFEAPFGNLNDKEMVYCVVTGKFSLSDPRIGETWKLLKEWSAYWQPDFLSPPPESDEFAAGKVAIVNTMNLRLAQIANNPNINFEWGTFYEPPVTAADNEYGNDVTPRRVGNLGSAGSGSLYLFIPLTTLDRGELQLDMARDLAQWVTAPAQVQQWCAAQPIPCFTPGTPIEEVFPDNPERVVQLRGFFEPGAYQNGTSNLAWATFDRALDGEWSRLFTEYMADAMTVEEAFDEFQPLLEDSIARTLLAHPEWDTSTWK
ncbi:MAG: extracellular solute-binding protein [Anaerolineaceae bacterium]|nr:extracellular solute-binding protein [Anaerolineaceae bacterium]